MNKIILLLIFLLCTTTIFAQKRHEISLGYGYPTALKINNSIGDAFAGALVGFDAKNKFSGSFNLEYMYNFHTKMAAGLILGYEHSEIKDIDYNENFITIMPTFKMNWVENNIFRFYSKVAVGITLDLASHPQISNTDVEFAYQVSPLGFELGKTFCGFAEIGYGHQGIGLIGIRYKF